MMVFRTFPFLIISLYCLPVAGFTQNTAWYKSYSGTIGKYPITLHLHKKINEYSGYYYYNSAQVPVSFSATGEPGGDSIRVVTYPTPNEQGERLAFIIAGNTLKGRWIIGMGKTLPFAATETTSSLKFDYIYTEADTPLRPRLEDSPAFSYSGSAVWPIGSSSQALLLKKVIRQIHDGPNEDADEDIGKILLSEKKQYVSEYLGDTANMSDEEIKEEKYSLDHYYSFDLQIIYRNSKLLSFSSSWGSYTGGAHPNHGGTYKTVDLVSNKPLSLDDVVIDAENEQFIAVLERAFRKAYSLPKDQPLTDMLFENEMRGTENFFVTQKGIGFYYPPYDIQPYAVGDIYFFIPFTELTKFLEPGFKKLIQ